MTRIVAGSAKGRTLAVPKSGTRPTSERVREALFSRLDHMNVLEEATVLDLYAGTGALGLEALSRGASSATLVEKASGAARVATANVRSTGLSARVVTADSRAYLGGRSAEPLSGEVDLVFIDPPYDIAEEEMTAVLEGLAPWIGPDALVVVERSTRAPAPTWPAFLVLEDTRAWGETVAYFAGPPLPEEDAEEPAQAPEEATASSPEEGPQ
nr:16S rRNA (guanine(966)-N(2))-methyltransferase RsmD [uncultured Actinomyces sp.]